MEFEFGETRESEAFFDRNPNFMATFERLRKLANKCFGRQLKPKSRAGDVCFGLGYASRQEFLEVIFLAVNGYGSAASKIVRGLYERALTVAYITKNPERTERFFLFAAVQEHRLLESAFKVYSKKEFDERVGLPNTVQEIRERCRSVRQGFEKSVCKQCGTTTTVSGMYRPVRPAPCNSFLATNKFSTTNSKSSRLARELCADVLLFPVIIGGVFALAGVLST